MQNHTPCFHHNFNLKILSFLNETLIIFFSFLYINFCHVISELHDYWVMKTDYTSYAMVYSCLGHSGSTCTHDKAWLWGRTKSLPNARIEEARTLFDSLCMNMTLWYETPFIGQGKIWNIYIIFLENGMIYRVSVSLILSRSWIPKIVLETEQLLSHVNKNRTRITSLRKIAFITPPRNRGGVIFSLQFVCLSVYLSVCLSVCLMFSCEQNSSRMDEPIWTRF